MPVSEKKNKRILVAPLDWGLGHATRCIPIIRELLHLGCEVLIGAEGSQAALFGEEFPQITILPLAGYHIQYSAGASGFGMKMIRQLPKIRKAVHRENKWLKKIISDYSIDAVISDNRFGLYHPDVRCIFMTHQLLVKSPFGKSGEKWLQKVNYHYIQKFDACWVVDFEGGKNLAGELSHPEKFPQNIPIKYIGALSRFSFHDVPDEKYELLVLISGPEPQRTLLEKMILEQVKATGLKMLIVRGIPGSPFDENISDTIRIVNHLNSHDLNKAILQSKLIICRSGYTSLMDLIKLRKKAILIPTPGQTEQEYLAGYLAQKGYFPVVQQEDFNLKTALKKAADFPFYFNNDLFMEEYKMAVKQLVD